MREAQARKICTRLLAYLQLYPGRARVHSVFPRALNIEARFGIFSVLQGEGGLRPFSCETGPLMPFTELPCKAGEELRILDNCIEFPASDWVLRLSGAQAVDLSVDAILHSIVPVDLPLRMRYLLRVLTEHAQSEDMTPLVIAGAADNPYTTLLRPRIEELRAAVDEQDLRAAAETAGAMSGCGMGLTPASDDFLCGYMSAYAVLSKALGRRRERVLPLTRAMAGEAAKHTNDLSAAFLLQSGEGLMAEPVFALLLALFSDAPYQSLTMHAARVAALGASSGTDMLSGLYLSIRHHLGGIEID
ncbi:MAG: DUF2877 domain-containing protein [Clostridiales bacterium]|nr:DUF2877 domain-containing protein [Clostridiales bacterium]